MVGGPPRKIKIVYCYDHEDNESQKELDKHLSSLKHLGRITTWFDGKIQPGSDWKSEIETHVSKADIILLLVSADFMASKLLRESEMQQALERHQAGTAHVIPIILRPVDWEESIIGTLQALPKNGKPITQWDDRDQAFLDVVRGIREVINTLIPKQILSPHETRILYPEEVDQPAQPSATLPLQIPLEPSLSTTPEISSPVTKIQLPLTSPPFRATEISTQASGAISSVKASLAHTAQPLDTPAPLSSPSPGAVSSSKQLRKVPHRLFVFGVLLVAILLLLVAVLVPKSSVETRVFSFSGLPTLSIEGGNFASIYIHPEGTSTGFEIVVQATKHTRLGDFIPIPVSYLQTDNKLLITPNGSSSDTQNIDLDIGVPHTTVVQVISDAGSIEVCGIKGSTSIPLTQVCN